MSTTFQPASPPPLNLCTTLTESKRILNAHSRHFLALSVLFLLPLSFSLTVYPTLQNLIAHSSRHNPRILLSHSAAFHETHVTSKLILLALLFTLFTLALSLLAVGSIAYSVLHGFYGRPVKVASAIKSAFLCFFPLLITVLFVKLVVVGILLASGLVFFSTIKGFDFMGYPIQLSSPVFVGVSAIMLFVLVVGLVYLQLNWGLVGVIVVVEGSWGIEPLKRSSYLVKGMKRVSLVLLLFFGFFAGVLLWAASENLEAAGIGTNYERLSWGLVPQIVVASTLLTLLFLYNIASYTILYMYCKAVHGELALEIAEEFAREYVSLPFDDGKVPHVVSVAYT
ncbi:hypothetical protein K2173_022016 [Erythroxylum novogranatense]|uniref:Transmembrane protein n=1 Tax=Erythroxylum novogranatense TaxID=1862640 RepID=A0AAV8T347_9ROSI|nr:hypothetical protein K2173_022016 [Erythroxylum novogranatense]